MYLNYYNLTEKPFSITPDPRFLYFTRHHREAYDHLLYGITQRKGFIELTGEVGSGKTTLCRAVLNRLGDNVITALVLNPSLTHEQILRSILIDLGLRDPGNDALDCIESLNRFLLEQNVRGNIVAVLIDEAQDLSTEMMEQVRLLSNLETDQQKLVQIVLCGQPELKERLSKKALRQLRQRITVRYHIRPLSKRETAAYIHHRLAMAGNGHGLRFPPRASKTVYKLTRGCPRLINSLCDHALLAGYVRRKSKIDARCIRLAAKELESSS